MSLYDRPLTDDHSLERRERGDTSGDQGIVKEDKTWK